MKLVLLALLSLSAFANVTYDFKNFTKVTDRTFDETVSKKNISIVVFNNGYCTLPNSQFQCFPFEVKLEYLSPKIIGITQFEADVFDTPPRNINQLRGTADILISRPSYLNFGNCAILTGENCRRHIVMTRASSS
jgi:hypothetical protein